MRKKRPTDIPGPPGYNILLGNDAPVQNVAQALHDIHTSHPNSLEPRGPRLDYAALHRHGRREVKQEAVMNEEASRGGGREEDKKIAE